MKNNLRVFSNLAMSLDGKIAPVNKAMYPLGTKKDLEWLHALRNESDIVVMGASTLRAFKGACLPKQKKTHFANAVLTVNGEGLDINWPFFKDPVIERIIFYTGIMKDKVQEKFMQSCHLIPLNAKKSAAHQIVEVLKILKFKAILVEGGGGIMWEFVKEDLIDDFFVTLTPKILGGVKAPSLVSGEGFKAGQELNLKLKEVKQVQNELYLHYVRAKKK